MPIKGYLTNEKLRERFENSFQLVNYAISLARAQVERGEELESNPTEKILESISDGSSGYLHINEEHEDEA